MADPREATLLCPYMEFGQEGAPCWNELSAEDITAGHVMCPDHRTPRYAVCVGCANDATRLCPDCPSPKLAGALCGTCHHIDTPGHGSAHGPLTEQQTPRSVGEPETGGQPSTIEGLRTEMTETVLLSMRAAEAAGLSDWDKAAKVVSDLGTSTLYGLVHTLGLAIAQEETG